MPVGSRWHGGPRSTLGREGPLNGRLDHVEAGAVPLVGDVPDPGAAVLDEGRRYNSVHVSCCGAELMIAAWAGPARFAGDNVRQLTAKVTVTAWAESFAIARLCLGIANTAQMPVTMMVPTTGATSPARCQCHGTHLSMPMPKSNTFPSMECQGGCASRLTADRPQGPRTRPRTVPRRRSRGPRGRPQLRCAVVVPRTEVRLG